MDPHRAHRLGVDPAEVRITCEASKYANKWIVWIPNNRYSEQDPRYKQILTEGHIHEMCYWKADLKALADGS